MEDDKFMILDNYHNSKTIFIFITYCDVNVFQEKKDYRIKYTLRCLIATLFQNVKM